MYIYLGPDIDGNTRNPGMTMWFLTMIFVDVTIAFYTMWDYMLKSHTTIGLIGFVSFFSMVYYYIQARTANPGIYMKLRFDFKKQ